MDADNDLDELLDEVEKKFCRNISVASSARARDASEAARGGDESQKQKLQLKAKYSRSVEKINLCNILISADIAGTSRPTQYTMCKAWWVVPMWAPRATCLDDCKTLFDKSVRKINIM
uniref:Uncharacterized protein n=1 Tax=Scophthalmus maximus TaxID=52904 RepID=A0A8D3E365_SCOMX